MIGTTRAQPRDNRSVRRLPGMNRKPAFQQWGTNMTNKLPHGAQRLVDRHPEVWEGYGKLGAAVAEAGPIDARTRRLVKLALAIGARSEGAAHSHARRAQAEGISVEELRHVALLAIPALGLPSAVAALTWIDDVVGDA